MFGAANRFPIHEWQRAASRLGARCCPKTDVGKRLSSPEVQVEPRGTHRRIRRKEIGSLKGDVVESCRFLQCERRRGTLGSADRALDGLVSVSRRRGVGIVIGQIREWPVALRRQPVEHLCNLTVQT